MRTRQIALCLVIILAIAGGIIFLTQKQDTQLLPSETYAETPPAVSEPDPEQEIPPPPPYETGLAASDGIGKYFMNRQISKVMGHPGIGWLERTEREKEEAPSKAIALLDLAPDTIIADIGAGSGYYSFRIAPLIPEGKVIAIDIQQEMLDHLATESKRLGISNVTPHLGTIESVELPPASIDAVIMVDAYHEFSHPAEMLASIRAALKPGGKVFLIEYRAEDPDVPIKEHHKMTEKQAVLELETLGFTFLENKPGLPWQHLLVFEKL
ncbi:MAG: class I SAM-dependent methyltransferase [Akkermansiaceae bacterium]|nr:class I SAM-dependent methyltransferase [Akkermansiaceae bacterium]MDP4780610.1 class I SAM-dependent methyltransferase [Akkermansiaceae bacterium]MDP4997104.1 class I SAM-dependent methyltransferase [Akkermansiaceae bacterium]